MMKCTARHEAVRCLRFSNNEVNKMNGHSKGVSSDSAEGFSMLFNSTAMAFEREAKRMSKQILTATSSSSRKRFNVR
jgi:hypothetical protein